jgi:hypothetical protein
LKLIIKSIESKKTELVSTPTNRIIVVDVSGSMSSELPKLRTHLKNKLPTMVLPNDTLSIVWFSSKGQFGTLFEGINISTLADLSKINAAIDRFLVPTGLTGFKDPLQEVLAITKRLSGACTLSFMTDGYENQGSKSEVLKACSNLSDSLASCTFVEYGYYADHKMIMDMAEEVSGSVVMSENFNRYSEELDLGLKSVVSGKKIKLTKIKASFVIGNLPESFVIAKPDAVGTVTLPANAHSYSYFEGVGHLTEIHHDSRIEDAAYAVSALILRGAGDTAMELASCIGDKPLYTKVENSFSKQDNAICVELANSYGSLKTKIHIDGVKENLIPNPDAYNVLTLLMDLSSVEGNMINLTHPDFKYNPIGDKRETLAEDSEFIPKFFNKPGDVLADIMSLTFNEDRPNVSILAKRCGIVTLPQNDLGFGDSIESFVWRNYSIIKDGIVNLNKLPVILTSKTHSNLFSLGVITEPFKINKTYVINLSGMPVINRSMSDPGTASQLFHNCFQLYVLKTKQKVLGTKFEKEAFGKNFSELYGSDGAAFLKGYGISEGGFSPKTVKSESVDPYISKVLEVKLGGLSSIPKVADVEAAIAKGKALTPSQKVMSVVIDAMVSVTDFKEELKLNKIEIKILSNAIVKQKFGIILGKKMPSDVTNPEDTSMELDFSIGKVVKCSFLMSDKEV